MIDYSGGMLLAIKGFSAAMLGGMGSFVGAVIGAFVFSFLESFAATFLSGSLKELVTFIVIINVLLFMPNGIMGPRTREGLEEEEVLGE
jgi:branched-chain amino acid transport system permease protein